MNLVCEMDSLKDINSELESELAKMNEELHRKSEYDKNIEDKIQELDFYKRENDLLRKVYNLNKGFIPGLYQSLPIVQTLPGVGLYLLWLFLLGVLRQIFQHKSWPWHCQR